MSEIDNIESTQTASQAVSPLPPPLSECRPRVPSSGPLTFSAHGTLNSYAPPFVLRSDLPFSARWRVGTRRTQPRGQNRRLATYSRGASPRSRNPWSREDHGVRRQFC